MKKLISRVCCLCCVVLVLAACLPLSAFAVDPVSAGVMANAFAQAIAAYGASNGVAMTFDVASTDGIGESVHELWKDFRAGTQDADDYATLAAALFPDLYYKASSVVAGAADVYTVGYNISSTYAEQFDNFFDWLLSGPAEMVKVDNAYYQFSSEQIGADAVPIDVQNTYSPNNFPGQPIPQISSFSNINNSNSFTMSGPIPSNASSYSDYRLVAAAASGSTAYVCFIRANNHYEPFVIFPSSSNMSARFQIQYGASRKEYSSVFPRYQYQNTSWYYDDYLSWSSGWHDCIDATVAVSSNVPIYSDIATAIYNLGLSVDPVVTDSVGVKAYTSTGVAQFPDTTDPNYEAVGKQIPSTVPWDNTAYGDGTGTLTDAEAGAIAAGADTAIARDGVLDLAGTDEVTDEPGVDDPPTTDPDDYAVPGLAEIFPFCIPFDIYNFLSALAANPVAPHFTATLDFPEAVGGTQTIDIDFDSPTWNQLAQLLRLLELLAFIIGLALLTRSMFLRG